MGCTMSPLLVIQILQSVLWSLTFLQLAMKKNEKEVVGEGTAQSCICTGTVCITEGENRRDQERKTVFAKV